MRLRQCFSLVLVVAICVTHLHANSAFLDDEQKIYLKWSFDDTHINFNVTANTTGWFGIGFSPNGGMPGSDIITSWVKNGRIYFQDRYANTYGLPELDVSQDYTLLSGNERDGVTFISMRRKLDTGDPKDMKITDGEMRLIWAMSRDGLDPTGNHPTYHGSNRSGKSLKLLQHTTVESTTSNTQTASSIPDEPAIATGLKAYLDASENILLEWEYSAQTITITVTAKTLGWFGIGFSTNGGMPGSDIITAWVKDGRTYLQDRYATAFALPEMDKTQNLHLISGEEKDGKTIVKFKRRLNTCDEQDSIIDGNTQRVIWAMASDGKDPTGDSPNYHGPTNRGTRSLYLRAKMQSQNKLPSDVTTFDMLIGDVEIPATDTTYHCQVVRSPQPGKKVHMVKYEPIIQKGNEGFVHHMVLYGCFDDTDREHHFKNNETQFNCYGGAMPGDLTVCKSIVALWAVGGEAVDLPEEAGYPIGTSESPDYYVLEMHYDNPQLISGVRDNSGMRFHLTESLRQYDSGILEVGQVNGLAIPPGQEGFITTGICSSNCTSKGLPKDGINIFGVALHSHLAGAGVFTKQLRNGRDLGYIDADFNYDFNYQQYKILPKMKKLLPGDSVVVQCNYSTIKRENMTYGGLSTREEMCLAYLFFYPANNLVFCMSANSYVSDSNTYMSEALGVTNLTAKWWMAQFNELTDNSFWDDERNVEAHRRGITSFDQQELCFKHQLQPIIPPTDKTELPPQAHEKPVKPKDRTCHPDTVFG